MFQAVALLLAATALQAGPIPVLIVDGHNNHEWRKTTPVMRRILEETGLFRVDVATAPPGAEEMKSFRPAFARYKAVLLNYTDFPNPDLWPAETMADLDKYMRRGGGLVVVHAAASGFGSWPEFNRMIGVGGWGGRDEKTGPMIRFRDGKFVRDMTPKRAGHHGAQHAFQVVARQPDHPILKGLPPVWMHAQDEFYDSLRGPAENLDVLATGLSAKETGGTGENEPILMTVRYEKGRTFHTILGHHVEAMRCVGFIVTLQRGTEWAATGVVSQKVPDDFPGENEAKVR